jgi:hypothetical protein
MLTELTWNDSGSIRSSMCLHMLLTSTLKKLESDPAVGFVCAMRCEHYLGFSNQAHSQHELLWSWQRRYDDSQRKGSFNEIAGRVHG